jgi:hypothetical protein
MKRLLLILAVATTCVLAAVGNVALARWANFNLFALLLWYVVPAGAVLVGMIAASGGAIAARLLQIRPGLFDSIVMVAIAAGTMVLIYYLDYATQTMSDGRSVSESMSFVAFVDYLLTHTHVRIGRSGNLDTGELGQWGYLLGLVQFAGFVGGGVVVLSLIGSFLRCGECDSYLRRVKSKTSKELTFEEAEGMLEAFRTGDLTTMQNVVSWVPQHRKLTGERAKITFSLHTCPKCTTELAVATLQAHNGKEWRALPELETRRGLSAGTSLRGAFG